MIEPRMAEVSFVVKGNPVSQNRAWQIITWKPKAGSGKLPHSSLKLTDEGAMFKIEVAAAAALVRTREWDRDNEYIVEAKYFYDSRRPDVDGPGKLLLDALGDFEIEVRRRAYRFTGFYPNDRRVWRFTQQRELDQANPRAEITVRLRQPWRPVQRELIVKTDPQSPRSWGACHGGFPG